MRRSPAPMLRAPLGARKRRDEPSHAPPGVVVLRKVARGGRKLRAVSADGARLMGAREVLQRGSQAGGTSCHTLLARGLLRAHLPRAKRTGVMRYHAERVRKRTPRDALPLGDQTGQCADGVGKASTTA